MTGEITLHGQVLKIGGLKEKLLAAKRAGIKRVIIPHENEAELSEFPKQITKSLEILPVKWIDEVVSYALTEQPKPKPTSTRSRRTKQTISKTRSKQNEPKSKSH